MQSTDAQKHYKVIWGRQQNINTTKHLYLQPRVFSQSLRLPCHLQLTYCARNRWQLRFENWPWERQRHGNPIPVPGGEGLWLWWQEVMPQYGYGHWTSWLLMITSWYGVSHRASARLLRCHWCTDMQPSVPGNWSHGDEICCPVTGPCHAALDQGRELGLAYSRPKAPSTSWEWHWS